ncbi:[citrate (pro-3S)-lyase] ligase [Acidaminobacter sp. JC074]|uniref:[citrate (pro-3S)-lyase] ligase n=1 Tax=Acidaminobacter sp. JC074 TaxID=2530199 RepID=UPI001F0CEBFC|nr:[citrate (pro-3S)-lyase] ligase [Acidaminobacter sp. JC074]MCH4890680.1 [citrate (pro-3S)-lyase] ligase [Acidaminobacter sp. JC074]
MERVYYWESKALTQVTDFLCYMDLRLENYDELYVIRDKNEIIATGAIKGKVLKCIAVREHGGNLINKVMTHLINRVNELGYNDCFIYTKPSVYKSFEFLGFKKIAVTENVVLMENSLDGFKVFLNNLKLYKKKGYSGAVVVNCNPFTLGHRHLIEYASNLCDHLHVFLVWEDASTFSKEVRYNLVAKGISHLKNVSLHKGMDYIISNATFPSYFLKDDVDVIKEQIKLDLNIFESIAEVLNITHRFIGQEPFNPVTNMYNRLMAQELSKKNIQVTEIKRKAVDGEIISASKVRELIAKGSICEVKTFVPNSTYNFLLSYEGLKIIECLRKEYNSEHLV